MKVISPAGQKLIMGGIVLLGLVTGYMFFSQVTSLNTEPVPPLEVNRDLKKFDNLKFNFSIFEIPNFKELQIFGESPVERGTEGKNDLFAPF